MTQAAGARTVIDQQIVSTQDGLLHLQALLSELPPDQTFNRLGLEFRVQQLATPIAAWLTLIRPLSNPRNG